MNKLFKENLGLVRYIVNQFYNKYKNVNFYLEEEDLYQEGLIGLHKAIESYNPNKGTKFSTYAYKIINNFVIKHICKVNGYSSNFIVKPDSYILCNKIAKYIDRNTKSTIEDISFEFNISKVKVKNMLKLIEYLKKSTCKIDECEEFLLYKNDRDYLDSIGIKMDTNKLLNYLDKREREIIKLYFGLEESPKKYKLIGNIYGCSKQRIERIINNALAKLKRHAKKELVEYIN